MMTLFEDKKTKANLPERKEAFINRSIRCAEPLGMSVKSLEDFISYWTEHNENGYKMRFEKEPTWNTPGRLRTWINNERKFKPNKKTGANDKTNWGSHL